MKQERAGINRPLRLSLSLCELPDCVLTRACGVLIGLNEALYSDDNHAVK